MRFTFFVFLFSLLNSMLASSQSTNYNQVLADLIGTKKWFDIENYFQENKDSIDSEFVRLWYVAETGNVFNRPMEAINAYEQLMDKNLLNMKCTELLQLFGQPVLQLCADVQAYSRGQSISLKLMDIVKKDTTVDQNSRLAILQDLTKVLDTFEGLPNKYPKLQVSKRESRKYSSVHLLTDRGEGINFNSSWNGISLRTHFDTGMGVGGYIWNRGIADKIGVKLNTSDTILLNNAIPGLLGVVDSLQLGPFSVRAVPVFVSIEKVDSADRHQVLCDSILNSSFDIVLGLPVIKHLGLLMFDFGKKTMSFPSTGKSTCRRNLYIKNSALYLNMKVCNTDFLAFFDTGWRDPALFINSEFYNTHKCQILADTVPNLIGKAVGGCNKASISSGLEYKCPQIDLKIGDLGLTLTNECTVSKDKNNDVLIGTMETGNGIIGSTFFDNCVRVNFDFNDMVFRIEKRKQLKKVKY